jgi:hypothetical protein
MSGFGTLAGIVLRFDGALAELPDDAVDVPGIRLVTLAPIGAPPAEAGAAIDIPFSATLGDDGRDLYLRPLVPLAPGARHAVLVTTELRAADGGCVAPSPTLRALLGDDVGRPDPRLAALAPRYAEALTATGVAPESISAATVFTTHDDFTVLAELAADIRERSYGWEVAPTCADEEHYRRCDGAFESYDFRVDRAVLEVTEGTPWTLNVRVWLPLEAVGPGPFPTIVFGHGINSDRGHADALARRVCPLGFAVIAADAMEHGDHPSAADNDGALDALKFLGLDPAGPTFDALALSGNFNQTTLDRLQLIELVRGAPDVDGDDAADLDVGRLGYVGVSLGGMLGASLAALSADLDAVVLTVAGGDLLSFVADNSVVVPLRPLIANLVGGEDELDRVLLMSQAGVDGADPAAFGPFVLGARLDGTGAAPDLLMTVSVFDETVPPSTGRALARGLAAPQVPPVVEPVATLEIAEEPPLRANVAGEVTAGFFQYDRVTAGEGVEPSDHDNTPFGPEGTEQLLHFLTTWRDGQSEIIDPYDVLGTPPLP